MRRSRANAFKYLLVILALILVNILIFRTFLLAKETKEKEEWAQEQVRQLLKPKEKEEKRSKAQIPTPKPGLKDFGSLMSSRVKVVQDLCGEMRERPTEPFSHNFENLFFLKERSLVWCPVFKAASTVWMQNFFQLADITKVR